MSGTLDRSPERLRYFRGLLAEETGMALHIQVLLLADMPVAGLIDAEFCGTVYALQCAYAREAAPFAAGTLLLVRSVGRAFAHGCHAYDLMFDFEHYKERLLATVTRAGSIQVFRRQSLAYARTFLGPWRRRLHAKLIAPAQGRHPPP